MKTIMVCRCEEVSLAEIQDALQQGAVTAREVRHRTRAGMGPCQGRVCGQIVNQLVAAAHPNQEPPAPSYRAPVRPVRLTDLAEVTGE